MNPANFRRLIETGKQYQKAGKLSQALTSFRAALEEAPENAEAMFLLSVTTGQAGNSDEAVALARCVTELVPREANVHLHLGNLLLARRQLKEAAAAFEVMTQVDPRRVEGWVNLGIAVSEGGDRKKGEEAFRRAIETNPASALAHSQLGALLLRMGDSAGAAEECALALRLDPRQPGAHSNLATGLSRLGRLDEEIEVYRQGLKIFPCEPRLADGFLFALQYGGADAATLRAEHLRWAERCAGRASTSFANTRDPDRRLRIGILSPDLKQHAITFFLEPLLDRRDREGFEVTCYSMVASPDDVTARLQASADRWRNIRTMETADAVRQVQSDEIDVLLDLALHSHNNRLDVMARKPAPVQVAYLGYPGTTGLTSVDYALMDSILAETDGAEKMCVEQVWKLPASYFCYRPLADAPEVNELPLARNGYVTFTSFNNFGKISGDSMAAWAQVLLAVPTSRMLLKAIAFEDRSAREYIAAALARAGVARERLEFRGPNPLRSYLSEMREADIALDTFPCNGGTTTCHALWMGLPVVTVTGEMPMGRMGRSILTNVGFPEWAPETTADFVARAVELAGDAGRLSTLRQGMRARMAASPLMDEAGRTRDFEAALRAMWRLWCAGKSRR